MTELWQYLVVVEQYEAIRTVSSLFVFFYEKILRVQKHSQANINQQNKKQANKKQQRQQFLASIKTSKMVKVVYSTFWGFLYT